MREVSYNCLEVRNPLLMHNCLPACPQGTGYGGAFEGLRCCLRCCHYAALGSNLVCALRQRFAGLPKRDVSELSGSYPWEDRHLMISSNHKEAFFVCLFPVCCNLPWILLVSGIHKLLACLLSCPVRTLCSVAFEIT